MVSAHLGAWSVWDRTLQGLSDRYSVTDVIEESFFIIFLRPCPSALSNSCHFSFSLLEGNFILCFGGLHWGTEAESHSGLWLSSSLVLFDVLPVRMSGAARFFSTYEQPFLLQWIFKLFSVLNSLLQAHSHSGMPLSRADSKFKVRVKAVSITMMSFEDSSFSPSFRQESRGHITFVVVVAVKSKK